MNKRSIQNEGESTTKIIQDLQKSLNQLRNKEGLINAAYPGYNRIFGRDAIIVAWQLLDEEPEIAKKVLKKLALLQATKVESKSESEPGKILHEEAEDPLQKGKYDWRWPYYGSIDATPLFIFLAWKYLEKTGDTQTIESIWDNIELATEWMYTYGDFDGDGFIEYERKNPHGLFHQGWKDSIIDSLKIAPPVALVEVQGYAYAAYQAYVSIASKLNHKTDNIRFVQKKATDLQSKFHQAFWLEKEKYYALALDGTKKKINQITSNPGHLLFTGILNHDQEMFVIKMLFSQKLLTPFGIRTLSADDPDFAADSYHRGSVWPHDNWLIYMGLKSLGYKKYADIIKNSILSVYKHMHNIPELYFVNFSKPNTYTVELTNTITDATYPANVIQAWSIGALLNMLE